MLKICSKIILILVHAELVIAICVPHRRGRLVLLLQWSRLNMCVLLVVFHYMYRLCRVLGGLWWFVYGIDQLRVKVVVSKVVRGPKASSCLIFIHSNLIIDYLIILRLQRLRCLLSVRFLHSPL